MSATVSTSSRRRRSGFCDDAGEGGDGARVGDVALLGEVAHHQVVLDQPGDQLDPCALQAQALAGLARGAGAGHLLAPRPALAGVVQQHGQEQRLAVVDQRHDRDGQRVVLGQPAGGDVGDDAHGPQGVLVHRVGVVHVELHLGDDAPELRHVAAQHAGLVHQGQRALRIAAAGQDVQEHLGRVAVAPHRRGDQAQDRVRRREGVGVQVQVRAGRRSRTAAAG